MFALPAWRKIHRFSRMTRAEDRLVLTGPAHARVDQIHVGDALLQIGDGRAPGSSSPWDASVTLMRGTGRSVAFRTSGAPAALRWRR